MSIFGKKINTSLLGGNVILYAVLFAVALLIAIVFFFPFLSNAAVDNSHTPCCTNWTDTHITTFWGGGAGGGGGGSFNPFPVCTLTADRTTINPGEAVNLTWMTVRANSFTIDQGIGSVNPVLAGSITVNPTVTTTYTGVARSITGDDYICDVTIVVNTPPPTGCIQVLKETYNTQGVRIFPVAQFTFTLDGTRTAVNDATGIAVFNNVTPGTHQVTEIVPPSWTQLLVTPANGTVVVTPGPTCAAVVFKNQQVVNPPAPVCTLTANPTTLPIGGGTTTLTWTTQNATSATIDQGIGAVTPVAGGSTNASVTSNKTFTLTATGPGGTVTCNTSVTVPPPQGTGCIEILKETYDTHGNPLTPVAQFTFRLDGGATTTNDANGNARFNNVTPGTHQVTEIVPTGWDLISVTPVNGTVNVTAGPICAAVVFKNKQNIPTPPPPACDLSANPTTLPIGGGTTTLEWTTLNATSFTINQGIGSVTPVAHGTTNKNVTATTTFTGTATGPGGTVTCNVTVVVPPPPPGTPACTLSANPTSFGVGGGTTTLTWTTTNVTSFTINQGIGSVTPVAAGTTTANVPSSRTFIGTGVGPGGTVTCEVPVTVATPGPACTLSVSKSTITTGESVVVSWTSSNVTDGFISPLVGTTTPVSSGSATVFPPSDTTFTGTFTGPFGSVNCQVQVRVVTGGCTSNCGGGLNPPNVVLFQKPGEQPLASVFLSQIPYTGFEAGPVLTALFWLGVALFAALVAFYIVGQGSMRFVFDQFAGMTGVPTEEDIRKSIRRRRVEEQYEFESSYIPDEVAEKPAYNASITIQRPVITYPAPAPVTPSRVSEVATNTHIPDITDVIESRAHAAGVLMSPEAVHLASTLAPERAESLRIFGDILNEAVKTLPREDGWIMITSDRFTELRNKKVASVPAAPASAPSAPIMPTAAPAPVSRAELPLGRVEEASATQFVGAIVSGNRTTAFAIARSLEHDQVNPTALITSTATVLDRLYRVRHGGQNGIDADLVSKASNISDENLHKLVEVFAHAVDTVYSNPFTGLKLALAQAFEIIG